MPAVRARLVTVVTQQLARDRVEKALRRVGVSGYTSFEAAGDGSHGPQESTFASSGNVVFHVLCSTPMAARILDWVDADLAKMFPSIAYAVDVDAVPADHIA